MEYKFKNVVEANNSNLPATQFENTNSHATQPNRNMKVKVGPVSTSYDGANPKKDMTNFLIPVGVFIGLLGGSSRCIQVKLVGGEISITNAHIGS